MSGGGPDVLGRYMNTDLQPGSWARATPDKAAIVMYPSGETVTYRELDERANQLSHYLRSVGLESGDHVAFSIPNRAEFMVVTWGCHYAGLYYTALSTRLNADEAAYIVNDCGAKAFITTPQMGEVAVELVTTTPNVLARLSLGGPLPDHDAYEDVVSNQPVTALPDRRETNDMLYSSGTTGRPKGVKVLSDGRPLGGGDGASKLAIDVFGFDEDTVYLSPGPLYHAAPLRFCRAAHRVGGTIVVMEKWDSEGALAVIENQRVTCGQFVPTMFLRMLRLPEEVRTSYDISSLQTAIHAAAPCPAEAKEQMIDWWGPIIEEYYAGTEGNGITYCTSEEWLAHRGTVGRAVQGEIHILDEEGNDLPPRQEGGVYFGRGATFEYHGDSEKTQAAFVGEKSTLGDIGWVDEDGFLYLTDRKAFTVISGGVNIYPQEAENALSMHPDVVDAAVFGVPNDDLGEEVKAVVQPETMPTSPEAARSLELALIAHCEDRLAKVKCPKSVDFREELPRAATGKLYKRELRAEYWPQTSSSS